MSLEAPPDGFTHETSRFAPSLASRGAFAADCGRAHYASVARARQLACVGFRRRELSSSSGRVRAVESSLELVSLRRGEQFASANIV